MISTTAKFQLSSGKIERIKFNADNERDQGIRFLTAWATLQHEIEDKDESIAHAMYVDDYDDYEVSARFSSMQHFRLTRMLDGVAQIKNIEKDYEGIKRAIDAASDSNALWAQVARGDYERRLRKEIDALSYLLVDFDGAIQPDSIDWDAVALREGE